MVEDGEVRPYAKISRIIVVSLDPISIIKESLYDSTTVQMFPAGDCRWILGCLPTGGSYISSNRCSSAITSCHINSDLNEYRNSNLSGNRYADSDNVAYSYGHI